MASPYASWLLPVQVGLPSVQDGRPRCKLASPPCKMVVPRASWPLSATAINNHPRINIRVMRATRALSATKALPAVVTINVGSLRLAPIIINPRYDNGWSWSSSHLGYIYDVAIIITWSSTINELIYTICSLPSLWWGGSTQRQVMIIVKRSVH